MEFRCPIVRELKPIDFTDPGLIKRIRGNAYCTKVSPQIANRVAESSRGERFFFAAFLLPLRECHCQHLTPCIENGIAGPESHGFSSFPALYLGFVRD